MWTKIKAVIIANQIQSAAASLIVIAGIGVFVYLAIPKGDTPDTNNSSCANTVKIIKVAVEKDPAGDPESWLRFDYTTTAGQVVNCKYTITFYDGQQAILRTISDVEDTFQSPSGQIYNGYSATPYQSGMTAKVVVQ